MEKDTSATGAGDQLAEPAVAKQPMAEPASDGAGQEPSKKKRSKWPLVIVISVVAAGCIAGATVAILSTVFKKPTDAVPAAIAKILRGEGPKNVAMTGNIAMIPDSNDQQFANLKSLSVSIDAKLNLESKTSDALATISATVASGESVDLDFHNIISSDGDVYVKLSGINNLAASGLITTTGDSETNCIDDPSGMTNCATVEDYEILETDCNGALDCIEPSYEEELFGGQMMAMVLGILDVIDDKWVKIPAGSEEVFDSMGIFDNQAQCLASAMGNLPDYGKSLAEAYNRNQFITYSTDNVTVVKRNYTVYRLGIDNDKMAGFINELSSSALMNDLLACAGGMATNQTVTAEQVGEIFSGFPQVYAEIDNNDNFTRLYFDGSNKGVGTTADLSFSYPDTINVEAPETYTDVSDIIMMVFSNFFSPDLSGNEIEVDYSSLLTF